MIGSQLLDKTLEELMEHPISHVALLSDEAVSKNAWFVLVEVKKGALAGAVVVFRFGLELYPHKIDIAPALDLCQFRDEVLEETSLLLGSFTATSNLRDLIVNLKNMINGIESDARNSLSVVGESRKIFEKNFGDVFFPSEELEQLANTIEHKNVLRDSRMFLTASQLFMSTSGIIEQDDEE